MTPKPKLAQIRSIPFRYRFFRLAGYKPKTARQQSAVAQIGAWIDDVVEAPGFEMDGTGLILCGPPGVGKSHLAIAVAHDFADADDPESWSDGTYVFTSWPTLAQRLADGEDCRAEIARAVGAYWSILDDLTAPQSAAEGRALWSIIDGRYMRRLGYSLTTTNLPASRLREALGDRLADRLLNAALVVVIDGDSHRRPLMASDLKGKPAAGPVAATEVLKPEMEG